jgi:ribonuclease J
MTTITCYGAVGEIGGNKILLEDGERRLFFDFGKAFGRYGDFFDGVFIKERTTRGLLDPLALGLIPPLRGVLREDLVPVLDPAFLEVERREPVGRERKARESVHVRAGAVEGFWDFARSHAPAVCRDLRRPHGPAVDAVLFSHAHQDHVGDAEYLSTDMPALSTRMTAFISKVLIDVGQAGRSGAPFANPRAANANGLLQAQRDQTYVPRPWAFVEGELDGQAGEDPLDNPASFWANPPGKGLSPRPPADLGPWRPRSWPVDHSLLGAAAFAVETQAGWVAYTGDLRFHGRGGSHSRAFAEAVARLPAAVLLCEGTRLTDSSRVTESEVAEACLAAVRRSQGRLVVADFAPRNVERLLAFLGIASETGRRLLVQPKDAYLLRAMHLAEPSAPDALEHASLAVYDDPKASEQAWERWARDRYRGKIVAPLEVRRDPGAYLLALSLTDMPDMLDLHFLMGGHVGGTYIFSNSRAYDEEQMVDLVRLWNWTQHLGMEMLGLEPVRDMAGKVTQVRTVPGYHASGHANAEELVALVKMIHPRRLVPIHTEAPQRWIELLRGTGIGVSMPEYGTPVTV